MTIIWSLRMHSYVIIINVQPRCEIRFSAISKMESIRYKNLLIKCFVWKFVEIFGRLVHFSSFQRFLVENINYFFQFAGKILMKNVKSRQIFRFQWCHLLEERVVIFSHGNRDYLVQVQLGGGEVSGLSTEVWGSRCEVWLLGCEVWGLIIRVWGVRSEPD